jgi:hypothetical protein
MVSLHSLFANASPSSNFTMKKIFISLFIFSFFTSAVFAQTNSQVRKRIDGTDRNVNPENLSNSQLNNKRQNKTASKDSGAQRPVILSKTGISSFFGYDSKYFYRSNPLATDGPAKQQATGMWTNTFYSGAGLGVFDLTDSVVTPYIGASWTINEYVKSDLESFNYNSTNAYALLLFQLGNGWAFRVGSSYANDRSANFDTEDYKEFFPSIAAMRTFSVSDEISATFDLSFGKHIAESFVMDVTDSKGNQSDKMELSNFDTSASISLVYYFGDALITPKYRISFKSYDKGLNKNREDFSHDLGVKLDYPITEAFKASLFYSYSTRSSDGTDISYDYKSYDAGLGLGLNARF